jgi:hypothetical protein
MAKLICTIDLDKEKGLKIIILTLLKIEDDIIINKKTAASNGYK